MLKVNETKKENVGAGALKSDQRGITLIALIITIIVMLILVAVTITVAVNGGLFEHAGQAAEDTQNAIDEEQTLASGRINIDGIWYDSMQAYVDGIPSTNQSGGTTDIAETFSNIYERNTPITQGSYTAVIPKGFAVGTSEGINKIEDGLVIQDAEGNQFVWIPVNYTATGILDENELDSGFLAVFYRSAWSNNARTTGLSTNYTEPYASGYEGEDTEYYEMMRSVQENKGFYIGRYEAGSATTRTKYESDGTTYRANGTTEMVVKRDAYPYNYVGWGKSNSDYESIIKYDFNMYSYSESGVDEGKGAVLLSKELYGKATDAGKYGVVSTLCYGVQWDAMLDFVKDSTHNVTSSTTWGNYYDNPWTITRKTARYSEDFGETWNLIDEETDDKKVKTSSSSILLTTGASDDFAAKNIFDVAGNVSEWTNESASYMGRVFRGGGLTYNESINPASYRYVSKTDNCASYNNGFRPSLYIK